MESWGIDVLEAAYVGTACRHLSLCVCNFASREILFDEEEATEGIRPWEPTIRALGD